MKVLVIENVDHLSDEMGQLIKKELKDHDVDVFKNFMHAEKDEIINRISAVEDIYLESMLSDVDQIAMMLDLLKMLSIKKGKKYNLHIMYGITNKLLDWFNIELLVNGHNDLYLKIVNAMDYINIFEVRAIHTSTNGNRAYIKTYEYSYNIEQVYFHLDLTMFIHKYKIKNDGKHIVKDGTVRVNASKKTVFDDLSVIERHQVMKMLAEHKAKLDYDLEDEDYIKSICDDGEELIAEKKKHAKLLTKILK